VRGFFVTSPTSDMGAAEEAAKKSQSYCSLDIFTMMISGLGLYDHIKVPQLQDRNYKVRREAFRKST
jgi:hypothetical protein